MTASVLARVVQVLQDRQIPFALIGAAAMAAHGVSRSTYDTDLFSVGSPALDDGVWQALATDGIDVDIRHGDDDDRWDIQQLLTSAAPAVVVTDIDVRASSLPERCQELWRQLRPS